MIIVCPYCQYGNAVEYLNKENVVPLAELCPHCLISAGVVSFIETAPLPDGWSPPPSSLNVARADATSNPYRLPRIVGIVLRREPVAGSAMEYAVVDVEFADGVVAEIIRESADATYHHSVSESGICECYEACDGVPFVRDVDSTSGPSLSFRGELEALLNRFSMENGSDTPDFVLSEFLHDSLLAFDRAVRARERWYGPKVEIGPNLDLLETLIGATPPSPSVIADDSEERERAERLSPGCDRCTSIDDVLPVATGQGWNLLLCASCREKRVPGPALPPGVDADALIERAVADGGARNSDGTPYVAGSSGQGDGKSTREWIAENDNL